MSGDKQMKKRKLRKGAVVVILVLLVAIVGLFLYLFLFFNFKFIGVNSIHADALKYQEKHCLVFYPDGDNPGLELAKKMCKEGEEDTIYDYALKPYGDYKLVDYGQGDKYFIDQNNKELVIIIDDINDNAKKIISDYLRYEAKKQKRDEAYSITFLEKTHVSNLDLSNVAFDVEGENLLVDIPEFDIEVAVPLKYMQTELGKNFGYTNELYVKPRYVDPDRPMIAMTFDDGPNIKTTSIIMDTLEYYDGAGTFFCLGERLRQDKEIPFIKEAIEDGHEYGSHTQSHKDLTKLSSNEIVEEISIPANDLKNGFGYEIKLYRPPYGARNSEVDAASPYPAIMWNVDSEDWLSRDVESIKNVVYSEVDDKDVILFHDIYETTAEAIKEIVPKFISEGYQLVTVSEMMNALGLDYSVKSFAGR